MNICILHLHHDEFYTLITNLNVDFQVIGLSEIKLNNTILLTSNVEIPGYKFYFNSSISAASGVGLYVKSNVTARKRDGLTFIAMTLKHFGSRLIIHRLKIFCAVVYAIIQSLMFLNL